MSQVFTALNQKINNKKGTCFWQVPFIFGYHNFGDNMTKIQLREIFTIFCFGGITYGLVEVVGRGYTHWSMLLTGGLAFLLIHFVNTNLKSNSLLLRCLVGCGIITSLEFIVGCIVNRGLHMNVWDYSAQKFNLLGQICPLFSIIWFLICVPAVYLSYLLKKSLE